MYEYVLFDLDGTISDSSEGITKGAQIALRKMGIEEEDREKLKVFVGPPLSYSFGTVYGFDEKQCEEAIKCYREYYSQIGLFENRPYDGIKKLLEQLKNSGKKVAVATSKPEQFTVRILEKFGLSQYFDVIEGAKPEKKRELKHQVIEDALVHLGNPKLSEVVLVGDTRFDAEGAAKVGIDCIGVLYGFGKREELVAAGATYIVEKVEDIIKFI